MISTSRKGKPGVCTYPTAKSSLCLRLPSFDLTAYRRLFDSCPRSPGSLVSPPSLELFLSMLITTLPRTLGLFYLVTSHTNFASRFFTFQDASYGCHHRRYSERCWCGCVLAHGVPSSSWYRTRRPLDGSWHYFPTCSCHLRIER